MKIKLKVLVILLLTTISCSGCFYTKLPDLPAAKMTPVSGLKDTFILKLDMPPKVTQLSVVKAGHVENPEVVIRSYIDTRKYINYINERQYECR